MTDAPIDVMKVIAHPVRYAILAALVGSERSVGEIETATGIGQPTLSQQLSVLRNIGLVSSRREAKQVFYCTNEKAIAEAIESLRALMPERAAGASRDLPRSLAGAAVFARVG